jgi:glycosyltransferase involved in cell wall biosynthesis
VHNAQKTLESAVSEILEVLPELGGRRFEVCVVDDGSTDDTWQLADELATRYPQVRVVRHARAFGLARVIEAALQATRAEVIMLAGELYQNTPDDLRTLWRLRELEGRNVRPGDGLEAAVCRGWLKKWPPLSAGRPLPLDVIRRATFDEFLLRETLSPARRMDWAHTAATPPAPPRFHAPNKSQPARRSM